MKKAYRKKMKIVKDGALKAVHDDDLESLLKSLGLYEQILDCKYKCLFCGETITLKNLGAILPVNGEIQFSCNEERCTRALSNMDGEERDYGGD